MSNDGSSSYQLQSLGFMKKAGKNRGNREPVVGGSALLSDVFFFGSHDLQQFFLVEYIEIDYHY